MGRSYGVMMVAVALVLVLVAPSVPARGVLLESPQEDTGMPLFPRRAAAFYTAAYGVGGARITVYYTNRELEIPGFSDSETCGDYSLNHIDDPDYEVRYLSIEGEHVFFLWDGMDQEGEVGLCSYIPSFAERYEFFALSFPDDLHSRLPAVIRN